MRTRFLAAATLLLAVATTSATAGDTILWRGWMDFGSCNRVKWYTDSLGISWPTNESAGQQLSGELYLARTVDEVIKNRLMSCAVKAVAITGATAVLSGGSAALATLGNAYQACLTSDGLIDFIGDNISLRTSTHCNW